MTARTGSFGIGSTVAVAVAAVIAEEDAAELQMFFAPAG